MVLATFFLVLFFPTGLEPAAIAAGPERWVSIDKNEFAAIRGKSVRDSSVMDDVAIETTIGEIALIRLTDPQIEDLSRAMHEEFLKCSGFFVHENREEGIASLVRNLNIDPLSQLVDYSIDNQAVVNPMLSATDESLTRQVILDLSAFPNRRYNQPSGLDSANWIKNKWTALKGTRSDVTVENYVHPTSTSPQPSVIMTVQGRTIPNEIVIVGGHQDSINSGGSTLNAPGADDDASGIASITETIRILMASGFKPERTVMFMAYAAEEVGLRGSAGIAADFQSQSKNVVGVVQFDMTNFKGSTYDIVLMQDYTNAAQNQFIQNLITTYQPTLSVGTSSCGYGCSDHASWFNRGYPTSMPFESTMATHNSTIHSANDIISQSGSNANQAVKFAKLGISFVGELAKGGFAPATRPYIDFDGDSKTDISIFRPSVGEWWYLRSSDGGNRAFQFGNSTDVLTPGDFTGDGKTDLGFYRGGTWYVFRSEDATYYSFPFGIATDTPVPADYDGDGKTDAAVFRAGNNTWYIQNSGGGTTIEAFGAAGDKPVPADYDGDGKADIAIYRPSVGQWWLKRSTAGVIAVTFGTGTDKTVQGDYTGDGKADTAFFRPSTGTWYVLRSEDYSFFSFPFGISTDTPVPGDYDGDGKFDGAVFRSSNNTWYAQRSTAGTLIQGFGSAGDVAVPSVFVR